MKTRIEQAHRQARRLADGDTATVVPALSHNEAMSDRPWQSLLDYVADAYAGGHGLAIHGQGTRGQTRANGLALPWPEVPAIWQYRPSELVITVSASAAVAEVEAAVAECGQMLWGEPPAPDPASTIGGAFALGWSGPGRPWLGSLSDGLLGLKLITAPQGRVVQARFGGQVIKNVAGFDVSRLQVGARGIYGPILELSLRVAPRPALTSTLRTSLAPVAAGECFQAVVRQTGLPLQGLSLDADGVHLRLAGAAAEVDATRTAFVSQGWCEEDADYWRSLRDYQHPIFVSPRPLWRILLPRGSAPLALTGECLIDWAGALQWWATDAAPAEVLSMSLAAGGRAQRFGVPLTFLDDPILDDIARCLKAALDPAGLFNPGGYPTILEGGRT